MLYYVLAGPRTLGETMKLRISKPSDVSLGGVQVRAGIGFTVGDSVTLVLTDQDRPVEVDAEVRYSIPVDGSHVYSTGFRVRPATDQRAAWVEYVHAAFTVPAGVQS